MDDFKKYMQQHSEDLDVDTPRGKVWLAINQELHPVKPMATVVYIKWAVAACVVALAGFGAYALLTKQPVSNNTGEMVKTLSKPVKSELPEDVTRLQPTTTEQLVASNKSVKSTNSQKQRANQPVTSNQQPVTNITALEQVENSFTQVINLQKAKVNTTPLIAENPGYFNDFAIEMKRMERDEQSIKKDIKKNGLTDELLDQLINVYQQKLNVLKQLQNEIHKTNNRFKQNRGPVDSTKPYFLNI